MRSRSAILTLVITALMLVINATSSKAQSDDFLIKEIGFNTTKKFVEDYVVERLKAYYVNNVDDCWKTIRKKRGINLKNESKREAFLKELETDVRTQFQKVDELGKVDLYNKYNIFVTEIIGRYAKVHGLAPYTGTCGEGHFDVGFLNNNIRFISFNIRTTTSFSRFSGFAYDNNYVQKMKADFNKAHPGILHSSYKSTTNVCSDKGEPQYNEVFTLDKPGEYKLSFTHSFGPYVRQNNSYNCTYLGNHLTSLNVFVWNHRIK